MSKRLKLTKEEQETLVNLIQEYFLSERDEKIGDLAALLLINFFVEKIGPYFYNRGIEDSIYYLTDKLEDMRGLEIWT